MLNDALRLARVFHNKSQSLVAKDLGISKSYLSEIESGKKKVSLEILEKYSDLFNMPVSSLMLFAEKADVVGQKTQQESMIAHKAIQMLEWLDTITQTRDEACGE